MTEAEQAREAAIHELREAITALLCGEIVSADNHIHSAQGWLRELG